jgi:hypothetical protein
MAQHKPKTNRQILRKMVSELDDITLAIVRERLVECCRAVKENKDHIRESMKCSFIHPDLYIQSMEQINEYVKFEE